MSTPTKANTPRITEDGVLPHVPNLGSPVRRILKRRHDLVPVERLAVEGVLIILASADAIAGTGDQAGDRVPVDVTSRSWGQARRHRHADTSDVGYALAWDQARRHALLEALSRLLEEFGLQPLGHGEAG
jgi:hypothetical protein